MNSSLQRIIGWSLTIAGTLIALLSSRIVFPGLERLVGIETIVGRGNVVYLPDGSYLFTNPGAMSRWITSVAAVGLLIAFTGVILLLRARRELKHSSV